MGKRRLVAEDKEGLVLKIIVGLRKSNKARATLSELKNRTGLEIREVRQILRRLRRSGRVTVTLENSKGKKMTRVYR